MKYIVLLGDGMADYPISELGGRTPLEAAKTYNMDCIAREGITGYVRTIPEGFSPGSDVANLSIFGYDPRKYYTGRAPLEAVNMGIGLSDSDIAFRCNFVALAGEGKEALMDDFSAGHITTEESSELIAILNERLGSELIEFCEGVGYRHLMVWHGGTDNVRCTPPHDISGRLIKDFLPYGAGADFILKLMNQSQEVLNGHPVNIRRVERGLKPANSIWLWGEGRSTNFPCFKEKYGIEGAVISAVNLINGIGNIAGLKVVDVPGATGYLDTNYKGKVKCAIDELNLLDFVYLHVEAPDEAGHEGSMKNKIKAIEDFDSLVVGEIFDKMVRFKDYRILILCDHPTPVKCMTHTADNVPYAIYPSKETDLSEKFDESIVEKGARNFESGWELMDFFLNKS